MPDFDVYRVNTYEDDELHEKAAFAQLRVLSIEEVDEDEEKKKVYNKFFLSYRCQMHTMTQRQEIWYMVSSTICKKNID